MRCWIGACLILSFASSASGVSCSLEGKLRNVLKGMFKAHPKDAPKFVRGVFHDSVDHKNLLQKRGGSWSEIRGYTGGVDGCLYAPLNSMSGGHSALLEEQTNHTAAAHIASALGIGAETWSSMLQEQQGRVTRGGKGTSGTSGGKGSSSGKSGKGAAAAPVKANGRHPVASHNLNIAGAYKLAGEVCKRAGGSLGRNCVTEVSVLGALVAVEMAGGPRIKMTWGRKKGSCPNIISCGKDDCAQSDKAIGFTPDLVALDDPGHFRKLFKKLSYTAEEQVALMGAHTFGKLQVCAGGLNGIERGPFCSNPKALMPPLRSSNLMRGTPISGKGTDTVRNPSGCIPIYGKANSCWIKRSGKGAALFQSRADESSSAARRRRRRRSSSGASGDNDSRMEPTYSKKDEAKNSGTDGLTRNPRQRGYAIALGFGDGGFWDQTPNKFDNEYFKLMKGMKADSRNNCCGNSGKGFCDRSGTPSDRKTKQPLKQSLCQMKWCRSDRKGRNHMKSTVAWHEEKHDFVKKGFRHGTVKRMLRLAGDWALLSDELRPYVEKFAKDEPAFFAAFGKAFMKAASMGYSKLSRCTGSSSSLVDEGDGQESADATEWVDEGDWQNPVYATEALTNAANATAA